MGQAPSTSGREVSSDVPSPASRNDSGVLFVQGTGSQITSVESNQQVTKLLEHSRAIRLPHPILPPPPVKDDIQSALQGAQVMHDIRSVLGGLLGNDDTNPIDRKTNAEPSDAEYNLVENVVRTTDGDESVTGRVGVDPKSASSIDEFTQISEEDLRTEQDHWMRLGIDAVALQAVIEECTGGEPLTKVLQRQEELMNRIEAVKEIGSRLKYAMNTNGEQAKRTTRAAEKLDRIHVTLSGVQDTLESAVATANILGASHFAHDEEMCSFKNFLKRNPPRAPL